MADDMRALAAQIKELSPGDQLRLAADMLDHVKSGAIGRDKAAGVLGIVCSITDRVRLEAGAAEMALRAEKRGGGSRG